MSSAECPICFEIVVFPAQLLPCNHSFCPSCLASWLKRRVTCPVCRTAPYAVEPSPGLDNTLINGLCRVLVSFCPNGHAGATFEDSARGVRIVAIDKKDLLAACHLLAAIC